MGNISSTSRCQQKATPVLPSDKRVLWTYPCLACWGRSEMAGSPEETRDRQRLFRTRAWGPPAERMGTNPCPLSIHLEYPAIHQWCSFQTEGWGNKDSCHCDSPPICSTLHRQDIYLLGIKQHQANLYDFSEMPLSQPKPTF